MSKDVPPNPGENPTQDFEGQLRWADLKFTQLLSESELEGKSPIHADRKGKKVLPLAAAFSASHSKVVELNDLESIGASGLRTKHARVFPCIRKSNGELVRGIPRIRDGYYYLWEVDEADQAVPDSFIESEGNIEREQALKDLADVLGAPDIEVVSFHDAFPR